MPDPELSKQLAARRAERAAALAPPPEPRRLLPPPDSEPAADPPIPWEPLQPGELAALVVDGGSVREQDLPERSRAELAAYRARTAPSAPQAESPEQARRPTRERAKAMLDAALPELAAIAANGDASDGDRISAIRELAKLADVYEQAQAHVSYVVVMPAPMAVDAWEQAQQAARVVSVQGAAALAPADPPPGLNRTPDGG